MTLFLLAIPPQPVQAAFLCVWTGAVDNTWNTAGNWTGCNGVVPQAGDTVSISKVISKPSPVLNGNLTITRLDINPTGSLIVVGGATLTANTVNLNGRFSGPGELLVLTRFNWGGVEPVEWTNDGFVDSGGKITLQTGAHGYITRRTDYMRMDNFTLENYGIIEPADAPPYQFVWIVMNNAVIDNYGTFAVNGTYIDSANNSTINNHTGGTLLATYYTNLYTALINDGVVNVSNTELVICRGSTQTGEFKGTGNAFIGFGYCYEAAIVPTTFTFTTTSIITVPKVQFVQPGNIVDIHGTYGPIGTSSISYFYGTVTFHSDAVINSFGDALNVYGLFTVNTSAPSDQYDLTVGGNFVYAGTIDIWHEFGCGNGIVSGGGLFRVKPGGIMRINRCKLDGKQVENQGVIWWGGLNIIEGSNNAILDNVGTFNLRDGILITGTMTLKNHGNIIKDYNSTTTIDVPFENYGEIEIKQGKLVFSSDVTLPAGTTSVITGNIQVGELINEGTLTVNGTVDGDLTNNGVLNLSGTVSGNLINNYRMSPGSSPGLAIVDGNFTQSADGSLKIDLSKDGSVPVIDPVAGVDYDQIQVNGMATISGELYLDAGETLALTSFEEFPFLIADGGVSGSFLTQYLDDMIDSYLWSLVQRSNEVLVRLNGFLYLPEVLRY